MPGGCSLERGRKWPRNRMLLSWDRDHMALTVLYPGHLAAHYLPPPMTDVRRVDLLDPAEVARLGGIEIVAQGVVEGYLAGIHRSPFRGFSVEFTEHRAYQPGDEPRYLDWKILARADRLVVKQFEEETNLRAMLLVDA